MSVANPGSPAPSLRRLPFTIRLAPQLVNKLVLQAATALHAGDVGGLLFGLAEDGLMVVQAERGFEASTPVGGGGNRKQQDGIFEQHIKAAQKDPQTSVLQMVGWYSIRPGGGLTANDLTYHDWYFPRPHDVALILKPEGAAGVTLEVYCRTVAGLLSEEGHRVGLVRLSNEPVESSVEVVPRPKIQDDFFMRAYEMGSEEEEKPVGWKGTLAFRYRQVFGPKNPEDANGKPLPAGADGKPEHETSNGHSNGTSKTSEPIIAKPVPGLPGPELPKPESPRPASTAMVAAAPPVAANAMVRSNPPAALVQPPHYATLKPRREMPWVPVLLVFLVTCALTFAVVSYLRSGGNMPGFLQALLPATGLGLKVEAQGDRLLVSWDRQQAAVKHAQKGVLQIDDGDQRRTVNLDAKQVANGAILYHPKTDDVSFHLEVEGSAGERMQESIRVLDAGKPAALDLSPRDASAPVLTAQNEAGALKKTPDMSGMLTRSTQPAAAPKITRAPEDLPIANNPQKSDAAAHDEVQAIPEETPAQGQAATNPNPPKMVVPEAAVPSQIAPNPGAAKTVETNSQPVQRTLEPSRTETLAPASSLNTYVAPKPLRQVLPNINSLPAGALAQAGSVEVLVQVDETGKVTEAHVTGAGKKVNQVLIGSAVYAARQWRFTPAVLRGKAIASQHSIVFQFAARQQ